MAPARGKLVLEASRDSETMLEEVAYTPDTTVRACHEVELRLLASPDMLDRLREAPIIVQCARNKGTVRRLEAVYYDTPGHLFASHGLSLRVRRSGKLHTQTLKRAVAGNVLTRQEWEAPVDSLIPDLAHLPMAELGTPFEGLAVDGLTPIFTTKVRRHVRMLDLPDASVEIAFDNGEIEAGGRSQPLSEIELELKGGMAGALYEFGLSLLDAAPLQIGTAGKAERGYALALDRRPPAARALPLALRAENNVDGAVMTLLTGCQHHLIGNVGTAFGQDPEGVHQMRVALRRLRTAVSLLRKELPVPSLQALSAEARHLARLLGPARNWDVFVGETLAEIENAGLSGIDVASLREAAQPYRLVCHGAVRDGLGDPRTGRFLLSLGRLIERRSWRGEVASERLSVITEPVGALADRALTRLRSKALHRGRGFARLSPEERHHLRLTLKKLRYAAEFFLPLYVGRPQVRTYLKNLSKLQDALGAANDASSSAPLLHEIAQGSTAPDVHRALGAVIGWQGRGEKEPRGALRKAWRRFKQASPFW